MLQNIRSFHLLMGYEFAMLERLENEYILSGVEAEDGEQLPELWKQVGSLWGRITE